MFPASPAETAPSPAETAPRRRDVPDPHLARPDRLPPARGREPRDRRRARAQARHRVADRRVRLHRLLREGARPGRRRPRRGDGRVRAAVPRLPRRARDRVLPRGALRHRGRGPRLGVPERGDDVRRGVHAAVLRHHPGARAAADVVRRRADRRRTSGRWALAGGRRACCSTSRCAGNRSAGGSGSGSAFSSSAPFRPTGRTPTSARMPRRSSPGR